MLGPVELVDEVDSTNRALLDRARAGGPHGLVLVADHQTAGRGRLGRTWEAQPGAALLVSVLLRPSLPPDRVHLLTLAAALAARDACAEVGGVTPALKWPNDLVVERDGETLKLAGLLSESIIEGDRAAAVVVGMGLNLHAGELPAGAVCLDALSGSVIDRDRMLSSWLAHFDRRVDPWRESEVLEDFRAACSTLGRSVRVELPSGSIEGVATAVDDAGHLTVDTGERSEVVTVGDVVHARVVSSGD